MILSTGPHTSFDIDQRRWSTAAHIGNAAGTEEGHGLSGDSNYRGNNSTQGDDSKSAVRQISPSRIRLFQKGPDHPESGQRVEDEIPRGNRMCAVARFEQKNRGDVPLGRKLSAITASASGSEDSTSTAQRQGVQEVSTRQSRLSAEDPVLRKVNQFSLSMHAVKGKSSAAEQGEIGNVRRWQAMATAARKQKGDVKLPIIRKFGFADAANKRRSTFPERKTSQKPLIKKYGGKPIPLRPHSSGKDNVVVNRLPSESEASPVRTYVGRPAVSLVRKYIEPKIDPFRNEFEKILSMLWNATPQLTADTEDELATLDSTYWEGIEAADDDKMPSIGNVVDDITYAPRDEALRLRFQWFGPREIDAGLALQRRPKNWTQPNFERYMRHLVSVDRRTHGDGQHALGLSPATQEITALLKDENFVPYINQHSLNTALDHLCSQECFQDIAEIFYHLRGHSFAFNTLNFSCFLFAAAWHPTSLDFRHILGHMLESGFKPSGHTWFTFYQLVRRKLPQKRLVVIETIRAKGLMKKDDTTIKEALVRSLGWIEHSELVPSPAENRRPVYS